MQQQKDKECNFRSFKYESKFFVIGVLIGCLFSYLWQGFYNRDDFYLNIESLRQDTNVRLLNYIEGRWSSSIGDIVVEVDPSESKDFIVIELLNDDRTESKYKIKNIENINGLMGIVRMNICKIDSVCLDDDLMPIQFNKVFGKDRTITISYDSRLTYCIDPKDECTRAFKRIK